MDTLSPGFWFPFGSNNSNLPVMPGMWDHCLTSNSFILDRPRLPLHPSRNWIYLIRKKRVFSFFTFQHVDPLAELSLMDCTNLDSPMVLKFYKPAAIVLKDLSGSHWFVSNPVSRAICIKMRP